WYGIFFRPYLLLLLVASAFLFWYFVRPTSHLKPDPQSMTSDSSQTQGTPGLPWFEDVTASSGIDFRHFDSATSMHYIQETVGSGLGWIDYDGDGWPDLFCVQCGPVQVGEKQQVRGERSEARGQRSLPGCRLYRNNGNGTFTDVTEAAGLAGALGYGMGVAV